MPKYRPIEQPVAIEASGSDLINLALKGRELVADFLIPGDSQRVLRVQFERVEIIRTLDEMPLSTEDEETPNEGLYPTILLTWSTAHFSGTNSPGHSRSIFPRCGIFDLLQGGPVLM
jgi:hypothetical protein